MNTYDTTFIAWFFNDFAHDNLFRDMVECSELTKWHRELSVAIHTNMVVGEYLARSPSGWSRNDLLGALACAFHDVGKPAARTEKYSEERGVYHSYGGHEIISARLWEDWAARNFNSNPFHLTADEIFKVTWMIEHHRPWGLKDTTKRKNLFTTATLLVGMEVFTRMLLADNWGRLGDTPDENREGVLSWLYKFRADHEVTFDGNDWNVIGNFMPSSVEPSGPADNLYMLVGCSGSGKSTFVKNAGMEAQVYSWDQIRLDTYDADDYANAFKLSTEDKNFMNMVTKMFIDMVKSGGDVVVDNTNLSAKRRKMFIDQARRHGYRITAVTFPAPLHVPVLRQSTRPDKEVPAASVKNQYMNTQMPQLGEVDNIIVFGSNL